MRGNFVARVIQPIVKKFKLGEQPVYKAKTPQEGLCELEEIRRLFPEMGNPDQPRVMIVRKVKLTGLTQK
jgi:hypothetical protein